MSALSAVIISAMLSTPIVHVTHTGVTEEPRAPSIKVMHVDQTKTETGIDAKAVNSFVSDAASRYQGF